MSRIALPAEKIMAVGAIYHRVIEEIPEVKHLLDEPNVQVALIDAAVRIAMNTDTRDMGILAPGDNPKRLDNLDGTTSFTVTDTGDEPT